MLSLKTRSVIEKSKDCLGLSWCREGVGISLWWETNAIGREGLGVIFWLALALNSLNSKTEPSSMSSWAGPEDVLLSTSLATFLDKKLLVLLRDGRKLMGLLRSFDQFANVVLEGACERVIVGDLYCDIPLGLYIIRGENVVLIGELDLDKEELPVHMTLVSVEEIRSAQKAENDATNLMGSIRKRVEFLDFD